MRHGKRCAVPLSDWGLDPRDSDLLCQHYGRLAQLGRRSKLLEPLRIHEPDEDSSANWKLAVGLDPPDSIHRRVAAMTQLLMRIVRKSRASRVGDRPSY